LCRVGNTSLGHQSSFRHLVAATAPVNGGWTSWSTCSGTCFSASQTRTCTNPAPFNGGSQCSGSSYQTCTLPSCAVNGGWSAWTACTGCGSSSARSRSCNNPTPAVGGADCQGQPTESCDVPCPASSNAGQEAFAFIVNASLLTWPFCLPGAIAGGVSAGVVAIGVAVGGVWFWKKRRAAAAGGQGAVKNRV
jgi:hypothetical protein